MKFIDAFNFIKGYFLRWQRNDQRFAKLESEIKDSKLSQKRTEYMMIVHIDPTQTIYIQGLYDEYKAMGGNSYLDGIHKNWVEKHCEIKTKKGRKR